MERNIKAPVGSNARIYPVLAKVDKIAEFFSGERTFKISISAQAAATLLQLPESDWEDFLEFHLKRMSKIAGVDVQNFILNRANKLAKKVK